MMNKLRMDELGNGYNNRLRSVILIILIMIIMKRVECCFEDEKVALLQLKSSFHFSSYSPSYGSYPSSFYSWGISTSDNNCCEWEGVECSNSSTGRRITHLFVRGDDYGYAEWKMNASLFFPFQQLTTLSLQHINFIGGSVDNQGFDRLSTLENLESLDLSINKFKNINNNILSSIGRISSLKSLSLSYNWLEFTTDDIQGLLRLENLESLDLSWNCFLDNSIFSTISGFSSLKSLSLRGTALNDKGFDMMLSRLEKLESLDLSWNVYNLDKRILSSINNISSLKSLYLSYTGLNSTDDIQGFDMMLSRLEKLESLDLSNNHYYYNMDNNQLDKRIISSISNISSLKSLYLSNIGLNSAYDIQGLSKLVNLEVLDLSYNNFNNNNSTLGLLSFVSDLSSLKTLDLSGCGLKGTIDLQELDALANLEVLRLSGNQITKVVTSREIGDRVPRNLSVLFLNGITHENRSSSNVEIHLLGSAYPNLKTISLCENNFEGPIFFQEEGNNFSNLEELFFNHSSLDEKAIDSLKLEGMSSLKRLSFSPPSFSLYDGKLFADRPKNNLRSLRFFNLTNLEYLELIGYNVDNNILEDIGKLISLKTLNLFGCGLSGILPSTEGLCNLRNLEFLDVSSNELSGTLPQCIANLTSLQNLYLYDNHFSGSISPMRSLTSLEFLDFSNNQFKVPLSLEPFFNHSNLKYLYGENNHIINDDDDDDDVEVHDLTPKFQLERLMLSSHGNGTRINGVGFPKFLWHQHDLQELYLSNNQLKGEFPYWLLQNNTNLMDLYLPNTSLSGPLHFPNHSHKYLQKLDISNNDLNGTIPTEIAQILPNLLYLNLSGNGLVGGMPSLFGVVILDLSYNELSGEIPGDLEIGTKLILSYNHFEGQIFPNMPNCENFNELRVDNNKFSGAIPYSLLSCTGLEMFDASNNHLSGQIPGWIANLSSLKVLDLSENRLFGTLPTQLGPSQIREVYLSENMLQGSLGTSFCNCSELMILDLSRNNISGTIPKWIGELPELSYLLMSHNNLEGEIPVELCNLEKLSLLDLSYNNLSGHIVSCIRPGSKYMKVELSPYRRSPTPAYMEQPLLFTTKSTTFLFERSSLQFISGMDLSCNNLSGKIPAQIGNLTMIQALNLSHNSLIGPIPESFSNLTQIESLDLSYNNLYGKIPSDQLLQLHWLSDFSVAHNNLSGSTPGRVDQFATFENTSYEGNPFLCGLPLTKSCSPTVPPTPNANEEEEEDDEDGFMDMEAFVVSCVISYIVVLFTFGAVLYVNPYWRRRWFNMITNCYYFIEDNLLFPLFKFRASL